MSDDRRFSNRRRFLQASLGGAGALAGLGSLQAGRALAAEGRTTDTVRLTWGFSGLNPIVKERGAFDRTLAAQGIKVEWLGPFPNHAPTLQAVTGGTADFSFGGSTTPALAAIIAGSPLVFTQFYVADPRTTAIIAKDGSGIDKVSDLVGKSVAVNRSGLGEFLLVAALEQNNIDRSKVNVVYLNPPDAAPALASGKVDAWSMWSPGVDIARLKYSAHDIYLEGRDLPFQIDFNSWLARKDFVEKNPSLVRAVNAAFAEEAAWVSANPAEAEQVGQKLMNYPDEVREHFVTLKRKYNVYPVTDEAMVAKLQKASEWLVERKVLPEQVNISDTLAQL